MPELHTRVATSADGTAVEYLSAGRGPGVIVVPGVLAMATDLAAFAKLLARRFTVHVVQRRGRGGSGPQGERYGIARECEDIEAVRARTGARLIFGHSFGGLVALRAACGSTAYDAVAVYEPGVSVNGSIPADWTGRARREVNAGADFEAFITFIRGVNPDQTGRVPRPLLRVILQCAIPRAEMRQNLTVMPQVITEHGEVGRLDGRLADYREVAAPTLVMRGELSDILSPEIGKRMIETIPDAQYVEVAGSGHPIPLDRPDEFLAASRAFLKGQASVTA